MEQWKFEDPPNVAVFSDRGIFKRGDWMAMSRMTMAVGNSTTTNPDPLMTAT
jgi:hypothetical protein